MIDCTKITEIANAKLVGTDLFVVDCTCSPANEVELLIDSDTSVGIETCVELSRAIEAEFDRDTEDFSLTVASAGIGSELKHLRQYRKLIGKPVEVLLKSGVKILATLDEADQEGLTLSYEEKQAVEGKKRKQTVRVTRRYPFSDVGGCRNEKRWQDVMDLLEAGINVISAVNIQHIESLNEDIKGIAGIEVKERIPDKVLEEADEVVNIDLTAEELINRLKAGKIYKAEKIQTALDNFFKEYPFCRRNAVSFCFPRKRCDFTVPSAMPVIAAMRSMG